MFKELNAMLSLLGNKSKLADEMQKFQAALAALTVEGTAGGGMVTVRANGKMEVQGVKISEDAVRLNDREMLEDLVAAAVNQALTRAKEQAAAESQKMAANMGLPAGMLGGLPGFG